MMPISFTYRIGDTQYYSTMPPALTDLSRSANEETMCHLRNEIFRQFSPTISAHEMMHRLAADAFESVNHILRTLELYGGLVIGEV